VFKELRSILPYIRRQRGRFTQGVLALILASLFSAVIPLLIKYAVDGLQSGSGRLSLLIAATCIAALFQGLLRYAARMRILNAARDIEFELRRDFYVRLISLPYPFFKKHHRGDLIARMMNDVGNVRMMIGMGILHFAGAVTTTIVSLIMMLRLNATITLLSIFPLAFLFLFIKVYMKRFQHIFKEVQDAYGALSKGVNEVLSGIRVIKNYVLQEAERQRFDVLNKAYMDKNLASVKVWGAIFPSLGFLGGMGTLLVMWVGGYALIHQKITLGDFIALNTYYMMVMWPVAALGWILSLYQKGLASVKRLELVSEEEVEKEEGIVLSGEDFTLSIDGVGLKKSDIPVLDNVSFEAKQGEKVLIIGPTGSGKSTVLNLIVGLEEEYDGEIRLGGTEMRSIALPCRRRHMAVVPQDPFLYSLSINENVSFQQDAEPLIDVVGMRDEVARFENGLETIIGERGITLSGGQKQRLTLARALSVEPNILLLDDPFTHVDGYTEHAIWEKLSPMLEGKTVIIASTRPVPLHLIDQVIVLVEGTVADQGPPMEVLERDAYMKLLYERREVD
jgi:ATP-binding cassette, subfamily B, multidrug efflux pump